jgi:flagellar FliL protein
MAGKDADKDKGTEEKGGKKKKIIIIAPLVLLLAAAGWFFFLRGGEETTTLPAPEAGEMIEVEPITINLAGGHFLKIGMGLQVVKDAHAAPSSAKALDLAISQFSGKTIAELSTAAGREKNKAELTARIKLAYAPHHEEEEEETSETSASASSDEEHDAEEVSDSHSEEEGEESHSGGHDAPLTPEQAIKAAAELTVQPDVYEVYFTEFVMQ